MTPNCNLSTEGFLMLTKPKQAAVVSLLIYLSLVGFLSPLFADEGVDPKMKESVAPSASSGRDWQGIGLGPDNAWRVQPGFTFNTAYDSNLFREVAHLRNEDVIFKYKPSIAVKRQGTRMSVYSDYEMSFDEYIREPKQNAFQHRNNNEFKYTGERLNIVATDRFAHLKSYASSEDVEFSSFVTNDVDTELSYKLTSKFSAAVLFKNNLFSYLDSILKKFSYMNYDFGGRIYYHLTDKTDFYVQGSGGFVDYYRESVYDSASAASLAGLRGQFTDKLTLDVNTGYRRRGYEREDINSYNAWTYQGTLYYQLTPKIGANLSGKKDIQESTYQSVGYFELMNAELNFDYQLMRLLTAKLGGSYQNNDYPAETIEAGHLTKRNDDISSATFRLIYGPFSNVSVEAGYAFRTRQSNFDTLEYMDHYIDTGLSYKFG